MRHKLARRLIKIKPGGMGNTEKQQASKKRAQAVHFKGGRNWKRSGDPRRVKSKKKQKGVGNGYGGGGVHTGKENNKGKQRW